jgi:hypothetical protein
VPALYSALDLRPPDSIVTFDSPREGLLAAASTVTEAMSKPLGLREVVRRQVRQQVSRAVRYNVRDQVRASIQDEVRRVRREVRDQIETRLLSELPHLFFTLGMLRSACTTPRGFASCDSFLRIGIRGLSLARPWLELARAMESKRGVQAAKSSSKNDYSMGFVLFILFTPWSTQAALRRTEQLSTSAPSRK